MLRASRARQSTAKGKTEMTFEAILQIITEPKPDEQSSAPTIASEID